MTESAVPAEPKPRQTFGQLFKSYFYWTYPRGSFHYDVMVTLILLFIFVSPHFWDFSDKPNSTAGLAQPIQVVGNDGVGIILTVQDSGVNMPAGASDRTARKALRQAIEPVTGDSVFIERWETFTDPQGKLEWRIWAHR